jgi:hypothetical protein
MCFMWISDQSATYALYIIKWFVFITEAQSVYSAVRAESLYKTDSLSSSKGWLSTGTALLLYVVQEVQYDIELTYTTYNSHVISRCFYLSLKWRECTNYSHTDGKNCHAEMVYLAHFLIGLGETWNSMEYSVPGPGVHKTNPLQILGATVQNLVDQAPCICAPIRWAILDLPTSGVIQKLRPLRREHTAQPFFTDVL